MGKKVLIVGGVAGGASTAARLRRVDEAVEIIMFERGDYISFANCGLPYYIGGTIEDRDALLVQTPEAMKERFNIDVRVNNEVLSINRNDKKVRVKNLKTGKEYEESYDKLVLSPGSSPIKPRIEGIDSSNVFSLWNIPDMDAIKSYINKNKPKRAVVVGGGFIGIEMVENLYDLGLDVTLVEMLDQVMAPVDYDMAQIIHQHIRSKGVHLYLENGVSKFNYKSDITIVELQDGTKIESDIVILSIGIRPNSELAKSADLKINKRGGIIVDDYLKTSDSDIYALGDSIEVVDYISKDKTMIPLAGPANKQGRIVANNICGKDEKYVGTQGTSIAKVFDLAVATTGHNEKQLKNQDKKYGEDYFVTIVQPKSHAGYYPGAIPMTLKLLYKKDGSILGAQIIGYDGVDKRIDVIATTLHLGGTIYDLKELELAYAPPFSSAKDPVNMAGFTAENFINGDVDNIMWHELEELRDSSILLDVREPIEKEIGDISGSINISVDELRDRMGELDKKKPIIVYCAVGLRGYIAVRILKQNGFVAKNLLGGYNFYKCVMNKYDGNNSQPDEDSTIFTMPSNVTNTDEEVEMDGQSIELNACGLQCPGPIMQVNNKIKELNIGDTLVVSATDPGFSADIQAWCKKTENTFVKSEKQDKSFVVTIKKGKKEKENISSSKGELIKKDGSSMVVFSGDLDKALASFIIANGAAAMGKSVTMFFTFWGLNVLRRPNKVKVKKSFIEKMFGMMMPRGTTKLGLSKMNMGGMGTRMMRKVMKDKNVETLEDLIKVALDSGVKIVACTMSMDVMGIKKEELIDGIDYAGVASYLGATDDANLNLFI